MTMRIQGVVDTDSVDGIRKLGIACDESTYEDDAVLDKVFDVLEQRTSAVRARTYKFFCGEDDGKSFFFSDVPEGVDVIKEVFPEFELMTSNHEDWPFDYDYLCGAC